jgi:hypothetical protein
MMMMMMMILLMKIPIDADAMGCEDPEEEDIEGRKPKRHSFEERSNK